MSATATDLSAGSTMDVVERIRDAETYLPRVRNLQLLKDILERQPLYPGLVDRLAEVEIELAAAEVRVAAALEPEDLS